MGTHPFPISVFRVLILNLSLLILILTYTIRFSVYQFLSSLPDLDLSQRQRSPSDLRRQPSSGGDLHWCYHGGSPVKFIVPQKFFSHFYVLVVVWTTLLLVTTWFYAYKEAPMASGPLQYSTIVSYLTGGSNILSFHKSHSHLSTIKYRYRVWQSIFLLLLMEVQALRCLCETIYVFKYSPSARMHIFGYLTGLFYQMVRDTNEVSIFNSAEMSSELMLVLIDMIFKTLCIYDYRGSRKAVDDVITKALGEVTFMKSFAAIVVQVMEKQIKLRLM
ncbi:Polyprenol reductase 2 [Camellia lanceoleosa]|uniref:Polyprenol reductase 2 n=1 Tax=Camellia lanceoleosa TaxID=1840588 RepID=A0ACC0FZ42_9ERIC|nr:Polyprenol reductase 2 [Camellia lanceoleosa]